jgi:hypothetical protein
MKRRALLLAFAAAIGWGSAQASAQSMAPMDAAPVADAAETAGPQRFTSAAQARTYLAQNPTGARAEQAFRRTVDADLAAQNPELDPAEIATGRALAMMPGATASPEQIEAVINATTGDIGARRGWF